MTFSSNRGIPREGVAIRRAQIGDVPAITAIYNQAIRQRIATCDLQERTIAQREEWFKSHNPETHPIFVAEVGQEVIGWSSLSPYSPKEGYRYTVENSVYVAEEFQRSGVGKLLLEHLIDQAKSLGFRCIVAKIFPHNGISVTLHKKYGFEEMGRLKEVANLDGQWVDVLLLGKIIKKRI